MKEVKVFSAEWCSGCQSLKAQLRAKGIPFTEIDMDTTEGMKEGSMKGVRSLPTVILGEEVKLIGNSPEVLKKIAGYFNV